MKGQAPVRTYRSWPLFALFGISAAIGAQFSLRLLHAAIFILEEPDARWHGVILSVFWAALTAALLACLSNRLKVYPDRIDNRFLWRRQIIQKTDIEALSFVRGVAGVTEIELRVREAGTSRLVTLNQMADFYSDLLAWLNQGNQRSKPK